MSLAPLQIYLSQNALLLIAYVLLAGLRFVSSRSRRPIAYRHQLQCSYGLVAAAALVPVVLTLAFHHDIVPATAQVWSAPSAKIAGAAAAAGHDATLSLTATGTQWRLELLMQAAVTICAGGVVIALTLVLIASGSTRRILASAHLIRRCRTLRIFASAQASVPFSFWRPGAFFIVVPVALLTRPEDLRIALRHEAQHHRHGDTWLLYALGLLRGAFFLNPASHLLNRCVHELQEFACDEAVVARHPLTARRYCDCLLWVAENALAQKLPAVCIPMVDAKDPAPGEVTSNGAAGFQGCAAAGRPRTMLARRIEILLQGPRPRLHTFPVIALQSVAAATLLASGIVLAATIQDRRISAAEAAEMAMFAHLHTSFPITANPEVAAEMNRLAGTPDGRAFLRDSLRRMQAHEGMIRDRLRELALPEELLAIPLVESGYRNRRQDGNPRHGAGIWMFVAPTARAFGLAVDDTQDERLNAALETDAATRLLAQLMAEYGDWNLALLAYNSGSEFVNRSMQAAGTRDAFELARRGYENDPHYLARVMATIIVVKNASRKSYD